MFSKGNQVFEHRIIIMLSKKSSASVIGVLLVFLASDSLIMCCSLLVVATYSLIGISFFNFFYQRSMFFQYISII